MCQNVLSGLIITKYTIIRKTKTVIYDASILFKS